MTFRDEVQQALSACGGWASTHDVAKKLYGPTHRAFTNGRYADVETAASGSGIETALDELVGQGTATVKRDWKAPAGKVYRDRAT